MLAALRPHLLIAVKMRFPRIIVAAALALALCSGNSLAQSSSDRIAVAVAAIRSLRDSLGSRGVLVENEVTSGVASQIGRGLGSIVVGDSTLKRCAASGVPCGPSDDASTIITFRSLSIIGDRARAVVNVSDALRKSTRSAAPRPSSVKFRRAAYATTEIGVELQRLGGKWTVMTKNVEAVY